MVVFAAFGGSTNLILHVPAIAHAAGLRRPVAADWAEINRLVPRLVDALPNGPRNHPTVQVFMAGGVPEVMLHLRRLKLLDTSVMTASGGSLDAQLDAWESSERRTRLRAQLQKEGVNPDDVIVAPEHARSRGPDLDGLLSAGQSRAGRVGDQEHRDRSVGRWCRWRVSTDRARESVSVGACRDGGDQSESDCDGRCARADRPRADGRRHGRDVSDYERAAALAVRQARRGHHRRAVQRRLDRRVRRPHFARSAGGRAGRQAARRRHD